MIVNIIDMLIYVIWILILIRMVMSWVNPYGRDEFSRIIYQITEPMLKPFRVIIPLGDMGGFDAAPLILMVILEVIKRIIIALIA